MFTKKYVLHTLKYIYNRFIALGSYVKDTPILFLSLFSFLLTVISTQLYESLSIYTQNFRIFFIFLLSIPLFTLISITVWMVDFSRDHQDDVYLRKQSVQILSLALLLAIRLLYTFIEDYKTLENIGSFTEGFDAKSILILDISKSRGDVQEILFEFDGVRGVGYVDWFESLNIGDLCNVYTKLEQPENFDDFDYVRYLKNKNIYLRSSRVEIEDCSHNYPIKKPSDIFLWLKRGLRIFREDISKQVENNLPEPQASLLIGILFGSERAFSDKFEEQLRISGTTHIIAASGYNITVLIIASNKVLGFIKKGHRLLISLLLIWLYCILSGLGASILRATVMGSITILALLSGSVRSTHLLIPSGILFLIFLTPKILFDIGFQLSILATLGLIYLLPSIEAFLERLLNIKGVPQFWEDNLLGTISCTLSTLPISISIFGKVSLVSVFTNMLVLPLTESTMLYGSIALLGSFLLSNSSRILFLIPYIQLKIFEQIVQFFGSIEWGYRDVTSSWLGWTILLSISIFSIYFYPLDKENYYAKRLKDI